MKLYFQELDTLIGKLQVAASSVGVCRICFPAESPSDRFSWFNRHFSRVPEEGSEAAISEAIEQLDRYFQGRQPTFRMPLDLRGTPFQIRVWRELLKIPYGSTVSYGEVAGRIGSPRASQAVGSAVGRNPVPIVVPCHRVIGHDGALVGFGGGLATKEKLLELEGAHVGVRA
ncbi:methylated-DNA--[protein]-cysteine S-methyltransferase [Acidobacteria bacterium AH-259-D05]|nr:methylated-DNA--[protein]-cysteine S-methyltransferase [Acidobacteria bacterium AH-259-D05]